MPEVEVEIELEAPQVELELGLEVPEIEVEVELDFPEVEVEIDPLAFSAKGDLNIGTSKQRPPPGPKTATQSVKVPEIEVEVQLSGSPLGHYEVNKGIKNSESGVGELDIEFNNRLKVSLMDSKNLHKGQSMQTFVQNCTKQACVNMAITPDY